MQSLFCNFGKKFFRAPSFYHFAVPEVGFAYYQAVIEAQFPALLYYEIAVLFENGCHLAHGGKALFENIDIRLSRIAGNAHARRRYLVALVCFRGDDDILLSCEIEILGQKRTRKHEQVRATVRAPFLSLELHLKRIRMRIVGKSAGVCFAYGKPRGNFAFRFQCEIPLRRIDERTRRICLRSRQAPERIKSLRRQVHRGFRAESRIEPVREMVIVARAHRRYRRIAVPEAVFYERLSALEYRYLRFVVGACYKGFHGDSANTFGVGKISEEAEKLIAATRESFFCGAAQAKAGNRIGDIGSAVFEYANALGYGVVKRYVGHGVGMELHEDPEVPNFGTAGRGPRLMPGMTIAIEPMINAGTYLVKEMSDGWTVKTADGRLSAHYEHTLAITDGEPVLLTMVE